MTKRKRRTKAEMESARAVESQGIGFRDIFDVLDDAPKPKKRKRRTKAQIEKDNAKLAKAEEEKPANTTECTAPILAQANMATAASGIMGI